MSELDIARTVVAAICLVASGAGAVQLLRGQWLWLVAPSREVPRAHRKEERASDERRGRYAAPILLAFFAAVAGLLFFGIWDAFGSAQVAGAFSIICDVAMVVYIVCVVRLYVSLGRTQGKTQAKYAAGNVRVTLFVLVTVVLLTALSLLYAL